MRKHMLRLSVAAVLVALGLTLAGCNTMHGVGKDTERTGEAIQDAAD